MLSMFLQKSITKQPKFLQTGKWKQIMVYPYRKIIYKKMDGVIYTSTQINIKDLNLDESSIKRLNAWNMIPSL